MDVNSYESKLERDHPAINSTGREETCSDFRYQMNLKGCSVTLTNDSRHLLTSIQPIFSTIQRIIEDKAWRSRVGHRENNKKETYECAKPTIFYPFCALAVDGGLVGHAVPFQLLWPSRI